SPPFPYSTLFRSAVQFLGAGYAELLVHQEALAVVVGHAGEVEAHGRVTRAGPGGVARQHVDIAGLQRGEALLGGQRAVLDLGGIAEHGSSHRTAHVHVDAHVVAFGIGVGETGQAVTDTALHEAFLLHRIQGRTCMSETAHAEHRSRGQYCQGGFHHLHQNLQVFLFGRVSVRPPYPCEARSIPPTWRDQPGCEPEWSLVADQRTGEWPHSAPWSTGNAAAEPVRLSAPGRPPPDPTSTAKAVPVSSQSGFAGGSIGKVPALRHLLT